MGANPGECFFCRQGNDKRPDGPLCEKCRSELHGFRLWLRERCSTLLPLDAETASPKGGRS